MHLLSLVLLYGLGKANTRWVQVERDGVSVKEKVFTTMGGPFPQGAENIKKLEGHVNFFNKSGQQKAELLQIVKENHFQKVALKNQAITHVGCQVSLMQSCIANYMHMKFYYKRCNKKSPYVGIWTSMTELDWDVSFLLPFLILL